VITAGRRVRRTDPRTRDEHRRPAAPRGQATVDAPGTAPPPAGRVSVIQLQRSCPLDRFGPWLGDTVIEVIRPYRGDTVPSTAGAGLIVLGGNMSPYEDAAAPWLPAVRDLMAAAVSSAVPTLGICLGAQLLAVACGGRVDVAAAPGRISGIIDVSWRTGAESDPLVAGLPEPSPCPSFHADAISDLPDHVTWLGAGAVYPYQAFRVGDAAWGLQFHPEVSPASFAAWAAAVPGVAAEAVTAQFQAHDERVTPIGRLIAQRFAKLCAAARGGRER
jgi:GMP synthase (glutamine-hydrolysing)